MSDNPEIFLIEWVAGELVSNMRGLLRQIFPITYEESMMISRTQFNEKLYTFDHNLDKVFQR